jgi:hypothetical protein
MKPISRLLLAVAAGVSAMAVAPAAQAKIPIPCTGDRIVKVVDIPAAKQPPNMTIDLGYKFPGCFEDGEWIGYTGKSGSYIKLDEPRLKLVLEMAGLKEPPPAPSRWQYPWEAMFNEILIAGVIACVVLWQVMASRFGRKAAT